MKLHLHSLKLTCRHSEEIVEFADNISFFHGTLSAGKSTIARLVDFCLGGDLEVSTALQREFITAHLSLTIGKYSVLLERNKGENQVQVSWEDPELEIINTAAVRAKGDGPPIFGTQLKNVSDLIFSLLGYDIIKVRKRTGDDESPMVRLSFRDLLKFCYLEQEELDSSFFRLNTPILAEKSKDALNFFTGYYSETLSSLESELDQVRSEQRSKREAAQRIKEFLARFGFASERDIQTELDVVHVESQRIERWLENERSAYQSQTHFVDERRDQLRQLSDALQKEKEALEDLARRIAEQSELRAELISTKFKAARADRARSVLEGSDFQHCPNCGLPVSMHRERPASSCYLCLQQVVEAASDDLNAVSISNDLDARIGDLDSSLRRHDAAKRRQVDRVRQLSSNKAQLDQEIQELLADYESDRLARTRAAERERAQLGERARFLERIREMPGAVETMLTEADQLSDAISRLQRRILEEQNRLSFADRNFAALEANFLEALLAVGVPGVDKRDIVKINRRTLIPEIWPRGDENQAYSFYNAGSGGKKTLITICFALALHRTAATNHMPVPTLLIVDTPLKNITPDVNADLVRAFYKYLYEVAATDLRTWQIILIDQMLVEPPQDLSLSFVQRFLTTGDPEHPPLISYYEGP